MRVRVFPNQTIIDPIGRMFFLKGYSGIRRAYRYEHTEGNLITGTTTQVYISEELIENGQEMIAFAVPTYLQLPEGL